MQQLVDTIATKLEQTRICPSNAVRRIEHEPASGHWSIQTDSDGSLFDSVLVTTPAWAAARLLGPLDAELGRELTAIEHVSTATVNLWCPADSLAHPLDGYGFVVPSVEQQGLTAVTWTSSKHYDRATSNEKLIRAYIGRAGAELPEAMGDDEILWQVQEQIHRTMGVSIQPEGYRIQRWMQGSPQYNLGHLERLARIDRRIDQWPGLALCGASYRGVGIPDCIRQAHATVQQLDLEG